MYMTGDAITMPDFYLLVFVFGFLTDVCQSCGTWYYSSNGVCQWCPNNCASCGSASSCSSCSSCHAGYYGETCSDACPQYCHNNMCNQISGQCLSCIEGYFDDGNSCSKCPNNCVTCNSKHFCVACRSVYKGDNRQNICSCCKHGTGCDKNTGYCYNDCADGFSGELCDIPCDSKWQSCERKKHHECISCASDRHGPSCDEQCSRACNLNTCDVRNGSYTSGCKSGYWGDDCEQKCSRQCNNQVCSQSNGECKDGRIDEYSGIGCSTRKNFASLALIGGIIACIVVIVCVFVLAVFVTRKRRRKWCNLSLREDTHRLLCTSDKTSNEQEEEPLKPAKEPVSVYEDMEVLTQTRETANVNEEIFQQITIEAETKNKLRASDDSVPIQGCPKDDIDIIASTSENTLPVPLNASPEKHEPLPLINNNQIVHIKLHAEMNEFAYWIKCVLAQTKTKEAVVKIMKKSFDMFIKRTIDGKKLLDFLECLENQNVIHIKVKRKDKISYKNRNKKQNADNKSTWKCEHSSCAYFFKKLLEHFIPKQTDEWNIHTSTKTKQDKKENKDLTPNNNASTSPEEDAKQDGEATLSEDKLWLIAKLYMFTGSQNKENHCQTFQNLDISQTIKLQRCCSLFEFDGSAEIYDKIIGNRNKLMHSKNNLVSSEDLKKIFETFYSLLEAFGKEFDVCAGVIKELKQLENSLFEIKVHDMVRTFQEEEKQAVLEKNVHDVVETFQEEAKQALDTKEKALQNDKSNPEINSVPDLERLLKETQEEKINLPKKTKEMELEITKQVEFKLTANKLNKSVAPNLRYVKDIDLKSENMNIYDEPTNNCIKVTELAKYVADKPTSTFSKEFKRLSKDVSDTNLSGSVTSGTQPKVSQLGLPVVLDDACKIPGPVFIKPIFINGGYNDLKAYLACTGSVAKTHGDMEYFWEVVWQERCSTVVMLGSEKLQEKQCKCRSGPCSVKYHDLTVECHGERNIANFTVRKYTLKRHRVEREIQRLNFTKSLAYGLPEHVPSFVDFVKYANKVKTGLDGPTMVYCRSGIECTGAYIALDILTKQGHDTGWVDIQGCVRNLLKQRVDMLHNYKQYEFLHKALVYSLTSESNIENSV